MLLALVGACQAASPSLANVTPRGFQRGTEAVFVFSGARLADAQEVLFYYPGCTVSKLEVVNDSQVKATVKIAPDCRLGEHALRLRTASGVSELRTFFIGPYPQVDEKEPNSEFAQAQKIPLNVTLQGVIDNEDVDYFAVDLKKGQRLSVEIEGMRLANTLFDPYIAILDSKRFELATSDDSPLLGQDGCCSIIAPADGTFVIQVRESAYGGNGACQYRLHVGTHPRPLALVPAGGKMGEEVEVRFLGDPAGEIRKKIKLPAAYDPKFALFADDAGGVCPSGIPFRLSEYGNVIKQGPSHTVAEATKGEVPCAFNGVIEKPGDVDYFRFSAKAGQVFDVHCYARRLGSPLDSVMVLSYVANNQNGGDIIANDDAIGPDSYFRFGVPKDGEYCIRVTDHLGQGGPNYFYRIEFTPVKPNVTTSMPQFAQYTQERQHIAVPKGNRFATLIVGNRADCGGEFIIGTDKLPAGVKIDAEPLNAGLNIVPVVFEATPEAPVAGLLADITAKHVDPKQNIASRFSLEAPFVYGPPGQSLYSRHNANLCPIAVTEEALFKITVVEPKVPLVQNGSMQIKVMAERKAGFKGPINIYPLFNPPGVGSASAVSIAPDQNEVLFPINANGGAAVKKWKTALIAMADTGKGPVWISSQLFTLEIAPPFVAFNMERGAVEQGKATQLFCKIATTTPFPGQAKVKLLSLPAKATTTDMEFNKDTKEIAFPITTEAQTPAGIHRNLFCQVIITMNGEPIVHNVGSSELRVDVPLPPKPNQPAAPPPPQVAQQPAQANPPPMKRLTRLEQLRLEQEEREKMMKSGAAPPANAVPPK
jgi:hypothetical protein